MELPLKRFVLKSEDPEKVIEAKQMLGINSNVENVSYPLALKRIMGLTKLTGILE